MSKLEWYVGATVVARCGAGREEGFIFRGARSQRGKDKYNCTVYIMAIRWNCTGGNIHFQIERRKWCKNREFNGVE